MCPSNKWLCALSLVCSRTQRLCWTRSLWLQRTADRVKSLDTCAATIYKHSINWNVGMLGLVPLLSFSTSLFLYFSLIYKHSINCNVGMLCLVPFLYFSLSLFLSFSLSLFLSLFLFLYVSLSLFISFSRSLSLSLSRYPPAHPNNTTMASCMRAVAAVAWHLSQRFFQTLGIQCGLPYCFPVGRVAQLACVC